MKTLADFRDIHKGEQIIVCGIGPSLDALATVNLSSVITIGVNDIGRKFDPTYLVVINRKDSFGAERWFYIEHSWGENVFTHLHDLDDQAGIVHFKLGKKAGVDLSADDSLPYTSTSPYVALCLAAFMGARRIGLIGVDFTGHHLANTSRKMARIDAEYKTLGEALKEKGIDVVNLSAVSRLTAFPKISVEEFVNNERNHPDN